MFSPDFNPLLEVLKNHTDNNGNVNWNALISEVKTMASLFTGKTEIPSFCSHGIRPACKYQKNHSQRSLY